MNLLQGMGDGVLAIGLNALLPVGILVSEQEQRQLVTTLPLCLEEKIAMRAMVLRLRNATG